MSVKKNNDDHIPAQTEAAYEALAGQEEIYREEIEEEVGALLISYDASPSSELGSDANNADSRDNQLQHAVEELITGDSDDPPLSEEAVAALLRTTQSG